MEKKALRREVLAARAKLPAAARHAEAEAVVARVLALPAYRRARTVMAYAAFGDELPTGPLLKAIVESGRRLVLPVTHWATRALEPRTVSDPAVPLVAGPRGIPEPAPEQPPCDPADIDLVLVPGVAFDAAGHRLGYGLGFYDRFLAALPHRPPRVGLALGVQLVAAVPTEAHDLPMDHVVTGAALQP